MKVTPIAHTCIAWENLGPIVEGTKFSDAFDEMDVSDIDHLGEFSGRACYKAFDRKRPETATTEGYLADIIEKRHFSVMEHASVTFYVQDVSRSLLLELERHRFLSFSVESQRYVDQGKSHPLPVAPPDIQSGPPQLWAELQTAYAEALDRYDNAYRTLRDAGLSTKRARSAARAFLLNATPVDFVVTGNLRCWRDVIGKRHHEDADLEIQEFSAEVLEYLREIAPFSVQDIPDEPYGS